MKRAQLLQGFWAGAAMILLILDSKTAMAAGQSGVFLCLGTVVPALFPFFLLTGLVSRAFLGTSPRFLRPLGKLLKIPEGAEGLLIPAFLGGYPMGAQAISSAHRDGLLKEEAALRMLAFCSNAGPAFLLGMLSQVFPKPWMAPSLWGIHILSALLVGLVYPGKQNQPAVEPVHEKSASQVMGTALRATACVCGWVICFRIISQFLFKWFANAWSVPVQVLISGILELTGGCAMLPRIADIPLRYVISAGLTGFGGISVLLQTVSILDGLSVRSYLAGRLLHSLFSMILAAAVISGYWQLPAVGCLLMFSWIFLRNSGILIRTAV